MTSPPQKSPMTQPPITSNGKWTPTYIRENATIAANPKNHRLAPGMKNANTIAAAKLFTACDDGNEYPLPQPTSNLTLCNTRHGLVRSNQYLMTELLNWSLKTIVMIRIIAAKRTFLFPRINIQRSSAAKRASTILCLFKSVKNGIRISNTGLLKEPLIKRNKYISSELRKSSTRFFLLILQNSICVHMWIILTPAAMIG